MPRPVALCRLVDVSPNPNFDAAVILSVALGARAAHMVAEDVGAPLPDVWVALRRMIEAGFICPPNAFWGLTCTRKGETVARASYSVREHTFVPPVPEPADHLGGAA